MTYIKKVIIILIIVDLILIGYSLSISQNWLINSQIAFFASLLITLGSFFGYKKMIAKKIELGEIPKEDRDDFEIIEDPHDLYGESQDLVEVIKEERAKITNFKTTAINLGKSVGGALSVFRMVAYAFLFLSFLYLNRHGMLNIGAYLTGLAVVPVAIVISFLFYSPYKT